MLSVDCEMSAPSISTDSISKAYRDPNWGTQWLFLEGAEDLMFNIIGSVSSVAS